MTQSIFPAVRYSDARAAIAWLEKAFGAERFVVYESDGGPVAHAEMRIAGNLFMFGEDRIEDAYPVRSPKGVGGIVTSSMYVVLPSAADGDALHTRAATAGAKIREGPHDTDYASHDFRAFDLDGHLWTFGTYDPNELG